MQTCNVAFFNIQCHLPQVAMEAVHLASAKTSSSLPEVMPFSSGSFLIASVKVSSSLAHYQSHPAAF